MAQQRQDTSPASPHDFLRLNKALAQAGVCSRREADRLIAKGQVLVNGRPVTELGVRVGPGDRIQVRDREFTVGDKAEEVTVMLHKPVGVVTTVTDPQGRPTVMDLLSPDLRRQRVVPVGRLDAMSEGLLLLSTDGDLVFRLTHPRWHVPKVYQVRIQGRILPGDLETMSRGMKLAEGERLAPVRVKVIEDRGGNTLLEMELIQGVNRQIRRMCRDLGLTVLRLTRVRQGPVELGGLRPGTWRRLSRSELTGLKRLVDL